MGNPALRDYEAVKKAMLDMPVVRDRARFLLAQIRRFAVSNVADLLQSFEELHREAIQARDQRGEYMALTGMGSCYRVLARYDDALSCLNSSIGFFESLKDYDRLAGILHEIGLIHRIRGEHSQALANYQRILETCEYRRDVKRSRASVYNAIGIVYGNISDYKNGLKSFSRITGFVQAGWRRTRHGQCPE